MAHFKIFQTVVGQRMINIDHIIELKGSELGITTVMLTDASLSFHVKQDINELMKELNDAHKFQL